MVVLLKQFVERGFISAPMRSFYFILFFGAFIFTLHGCSEKPQNPEQELPVANIDTTNINLNIDLATSVDPVHQDKAEEIARLLEVLKKRRQFNGAVLVAEKGKIIFQGTVGNASFYPPVALTVNTSFHLASVSKQFTAMAIMMLQEEGKLNYDDLAIKYIPELPYQTITIRQLLQHTSGIPRITDYVPYFLSFWDTCTIARNSDVPGMLETCKPPVQFYPGRRFSYNNTGYILLALIIEKASGKTFKNFIENRIFKVLKMNDSFIYDIDNTGERKNIAFGYSAYRNGYSSDEDDIRNGLLGEKGIYSSAVDLFKWDQALYSEVLVKKETLLEGFSRGNLLNGRSIDYGFGWRMPRKEDNVVYHYGHWRGFRTGIVRVMDEEFTIIILNNTGSRKIKYLVIKLLDILYQDRTGKPKF